MSLVKIWLMSRVNSALNLVEHEISFIISGPGCLALTVLFLSCSCNCSVIANCPFLEVPWVGLWSVTVAFPGLARLFFMDLFNVFNIMYDNFVSIWNRLWLTQNPQVV